MKQNLFTLQCSIVKYYQMESLKNKIILIDKIDQSFLFLAFLF